MRDNILNRLIKVIVEALRPKKIILFGSRGKGSYNYNSDYDLAIDTEKNRIPGKKNP
ncbi:nucleotidyltransferase domain protein [bacterium BMS3Abin03]|nr:nucleotidyltransferase domain protein [bacterium BMS3Abin03]